MESMRCIIDLDAMPWLELGGYDLKVLRVNDDFSYVSLARTPGGVVFPSHVHIGELDTFFLEGEAEITAGTLRKHYWTREPAGALHRASKSFVGERTLTETLALNHVWGPTMFVGEDDSVPPIISGHKVKAVSDAASRGGDPIAALMQPPISYYTETYESGIIDTTALPWLPSGYDGVEFKVLNVGDSGIFRMVIRADEGAVIPSRRYTSPADFLILSGGLEFGDGSAAPVNH